MVVDPWGRVLVRAPDEGTGVWFADLDPRGGLHSVAVPGSAVRQSGIYWIRLSQAGRTAMNKVTLSR